MNNEPIEVWVNGWARPYDNLDRRIACTPQNEWTPEMIARVLSDQRLPAAPQSLGKEKAQKPEISAPLAELKELAGPIAKWLGENFNPHCEVHINANAVELVQVEMASSLDGKFIKD